MLILAFAVGVSYRYLKQSGNQDYETFSATRGTVMQEVNATGKVKPAKKIELEFKNQGQIKFISVKVGDEVKDDQEIMRLNMSELEIQKKDAEISLSVAKANLEKLIIGPRKEDMVIYQTKLQNTETALNDAKNNFENVKKDHEQKIEQEYIDAKNAEIEAFYYAGNARKTIESLFNGGIIKSEFDDTTRIEEKAILEADRTAIEKSFLISQSSQDELSKQKESLNIATAQNNLIIFLNDLKSGIDNASGVLEGISPSTASLSQEDIDNYILNISTARLNVITALSGLANSIRSVRQIEADAKINIDNAQEKINLANSAFELAKSEMLLKKAPPTQEDINLLTAQMEKAQAALEIVKEQIRNSVLYAPIKGTIVEIKKEVGESVRLGIPVISMVNSYHLDIETNIAESDIVKVRVGDLAYITMNIFGREVSLTGRVVMIDPAEFEEKGIIYYKTTIIFDSNNENIVPGTSADIKIKTAAAENVILVPEGSIFEKNSEKYVRALNSDNNPEEVKIETGLHGSDGFVEIVAPIAEGTRIIINQKEIE